VVAHKSMPHRVDAPMHGMQPVRRDSVPDGIAPDAMLQQLSSRDYSMLPRRKLSDDPIRTETALLLATNLRR
jgi:hypothetical protein